MYYHKGIPDTDILGRKLRMSDKVTIFNEKFIAYANCTIVEKPYQDEEREFLRRAIQVDEGMWFFGLGTHEILKDF